MFRCVVLVLAVVLSLSAFASNNVSSLQDNGLKDWEHEVFSRETQYRVLQYKNRIAIQAKSDNSASGLLLRTQIDLLATPFINWSWLSESKLPLLDEQSKRGDDYVARIYVLIDGGLLFWNTQCLSYVWSSRQDKGRVWNNAFAGANVKMLSIRGRDDLISQWYSEKRNVYDDLIKYFGDKGSAQANLQAYRYIDVIAIMTDTDNSGSKAESYYGDIIFTAN
ncbi:DUF3047 domain-containing protein [Agarivorans sp. TSD2052]|uniref:DUF3047 domain-containing protein n=1 Tax=Agarivorans sp. TSD2052 TaxID=2937286 RepID=UPI00200EED33|nr:DUF3047 domain-containing protein [Agarivorans sp. TSD2052]UPW19934.1 DUF3047 domain-containing protein [Agarivorans sp. TSD2052]